VRNLLLFLAMPLLAGLLAGCLSTKEPVFDASNSLPVAEIPEFMAFVDTWEAFNGTDGSPREMIAEGARGIVVDGVLVVQDHTDYFALGTLGPRPLTCMVFADSGLEAAAAGFGVTVKITKSENMSIDDQPVPVEADGPKPALEAFIRDQFANRRLACLANPRGG